MQSTNPDQPQPPEPSCPPRSRYAERLNRFVGSGRVLADAAGYSAMRGRWSDVFAQPIGDAFDGRIVLEIGCADGAFLATVAARRQASGFVGLDWKTKAIHDAAARAEADASPNQRFVRGRAQEIRTMFADRELDEIWIFHPDPCDRDVERPNRLFGDRFLDAARHVLRDGESRLCLKTDHAEYFRSAVDLFADASSDAARRWRVRVRSDNFWADETALRETGSRAFASITTGYEERFRKKRKPIYYLELSAAPSDS